MSFIQDGIEVVNRDGKDIYKGSLLFFIGDTPAANMVAGFKEGVGGAAMKCRTCYGSSQEIIQQVCVLWYTVYCRSVLVVLTFLVMHLS